MFEEHDRHIHGVPDIVAIAGNYAGVDVNVGV
jgi:hypothetical protein